jgi:hypothetical protein
MAALPVRAQEVDRLPAVGSPRHDRASTPPVEGRHPGGDAARARKTLNSATIAEMYRAFRDGGREAIDRVMQEQPAVFLKLLCLLIPRESEITHSAGVKQMSDEKIEQAIEIIEDILAKRSSDDAKVIDAVPDRPETQDLHKARFSPSSKRKSVGPSVGLDEESGNS